MECGKAVIWARVGQSTYDTGQESCQEPQKLRTLSTFRFESRLITATASTSAESANNSARGDEIASKSSKGIVKSQSVHPMALSPNQPGYIHRIDGTWATHRRHMCRDAVDLMCRISNFSVCAVSCTSSAGVARRTKTKRSVRLISDPPMANKYNFLTTSDSFTSYMPARPGH